MPKDPNSMDREDFVLCASMVLAAGELRGVVANDEAWLDTVLKAVETLADMNAHMLLILARTRLGFKGTTLQELAVFLEIVHPGDPEMN